MMAPSPPCSLYKLVKEKRSICTFLLFIMDITVVLVLLVITGVVSFTF
jgi:hypothetical protein